MKTLWQNLFGDSTEYIENFFLAAKPLETGLCAFDGEILAGMLFSLPGVFVLEGKAYDGRYLYAVSTDPAYRRQGVMTDLEAEACRQAAGEGARCMVLVPADAGLFSMYEKLGYRTRFRLSRTRIPAPVCPKARLSPCPMEEFLAMRREMLRRLESYFDFYPDMGEYRYREFAGTGREILRAETPYGTGYLAGHPEEKEYLIEETSLGGNALAQAAGELACRYGVKRVVSTGRYGTSSPYGMLKLLDNSIDGERARKANAYLNLMLN